MENEQLGWFARYQQWFDLALLVGCVALFSYSALDALSLLPGEQGFQPLQQVALSGALVLNGAAGVVQRRFTRASIVLTVLSAVVLGWAATLAG